MSIANQNLKYLRKLRGWTQEEFAQKLRIKRSLLGAYEEERAEPRIDVLEVVCDIFKLTLDEILRKDLTENKGNYIAKRRAMKLSGGRPDIPFVPFKAAAGYLAGYADPEFIDELNTFTLPILSGGNYRAFEIVGDSMMPTPSGSVIVCEKVDNTDDVKSNMGISRSHLEKWIQSQSAFAFLQSRSRLLFASTRWLQGRQAGLLLPVRDFQLSR